MNLGVTALMSLTLILGLVADSIPKTSEVPLLCECRLVSTLSAIFILANLAIITTALIVSILLPRLGIFIERQLERRYGIKFAKSNRQRILSTVFFACFELATLINLVIFLSYC